MYHQEVSDEARVVQYLEDQLVSRVSFDLIVDSKETSPRKVELHFVLV